MNDAQTLFAYSCLFLVGTFVASVSQILLKLSARKKYPSRIREYLNPLVIVGYGLFFGCTLISVFALKVVPLSTSPVLGATGYIFVSLLSFIFFKEKLTLRQLVGMALIIFGIVIYSIF